MKQILIKYNEDWRTIFADSVEDVIESMRALRDVAGLNFVFKKVNETTIEVCSTKTQKKEKKHVKHSKYPKNII